MNLHDVGITAVPAGELRMQQHSDGSRQTVGPRPATTGRAIVALVAALVVMLPLWAGGLWFALLAAMGSEYPGGPSQGAVGVVLLIAIVLGVMAGTFVARVVLGVELGGLRASVLGIWLAATVFLSVSFAVSAPPLGVVVAIGGCAFWVYAACGMSRAASTGR